MTATRCPLPAVRLRVACSLTWAEQVPEAALPTAKAQAQLKTAKSPTGSALRSPKTPSPARKKGRGRVGNRQLQLYSPKEDRKILSESPRHAVLYVNI